MADHLFVLEHVSFAYGVARAVEEVSLALPAGRFYGLVGPNGCGKTTLLDLLIGGKQPATGIVRLNGSRIGDYSKRELARHIALVPQDFAINFAFTVMEVVLMGRHPYIPRFGSPAAADYAAADRAMAAIGISDYKDRFVTELSGGEKQRVVVARALAQQTPVMLLDEATSNLDIQHTLEIFRVAHRRVQEKGDTVIAVIHNLNLAAAYCDEVIFMQNGVVQAKGPVEEVMTAANIKTVFGVDSRVALDEYCGARQVSYRYYGSEKKRREGAWQ